MGRQSSRDEAEVLLRLLQYQKNKYDVLIDAIFDNGRMCGKTAENGVLTIMMGIRFKACYKKLFKLLIDREITQKELAEKAGISTATLSKMKKGEDGVNTAVWEKICKALDCKVSDIVEIVAL